jgi:phosphatidylinositol-bisphosphatase
LDHGDLIVSTYIRHCLDNGLQFDTNILLGGQPSNETDNTSDVASTFSDITLVNDEHKVGKEALSANSMIDVLIAFLECLPEPVIPTNMYERALEAAESMESMNIVSNLAVL